MVSGSPSRDKILIMDPNAVNPIRLKILKDINTKNASSWIKKAKKANMQCLYAYSASIYYTFFKKEKEPFTRFTYGIELTQKLINASNIKQASDILAELNRLQNKIKNKENALRAKSAIYEKKGWLEDLKGNPKKELALFTKAQDFLKKIAQTKQTKEDKARLLTIEHFTARAHYFTQNFKSAEKIFEINLKNYQKTKNPDTIGFTHAWLARVAIAQKKASRAKRRVKKARIFFSKSNKRTNSALYLQPYHQIKAELESFLGNEKESKKHAQIALLYSLPQGVYYNGVIKALNLLQK